VISFLHKIGRPDQCSAGNGDVSPFQHHLGESIAAISCRNGPYDRRQIVRFPLAKSFVGGTFWTGHAATCGPNQRDSARGAMLSSPTSACAGERS
jgi:hypothetical protein